ncbi:MAG: Fic family protein [Candidatus Eremiobacteraeota bacterium]|nr:Fic family protein [Candidatus Eremiobacteraeota bacterium]
MQPEVIGIHPFEGGNGRSTRLLTDWLLIRLGLRPIPIEAVKGGYTACLNLYFRTRDLQPLVDLLIGLYPLDALP